MASLVQLFFFLSAIFIHFGLNTAQPNFEYVNCSQGIYTNNSAFAANLNILLSSLSSNTALNNGFYNVTTGQNSDKLYGLLLCRGDVTTEICKNCSKMVTEDIKQRCPNNNEAILWYDMCMLRYSNSYFFSVNQELPVACMSNPNNVQNPDEFNQILTDFMGRLANQAAYSSVTSKKFAAGDVNVTGFHFEKIYGLVQCTPDLTKVDCSLCLANTIAQISNCSSNKEGGRFKTPSCNSRYEVFPFYELNAGTSVALPPPTNNTVTGSSPPPPPTNTTITNHRKKSSNSSLIGGIIVVLVVIAIIVLPVFCICLRRRRKPMETSNNVEEISNVEFRQFDFGTIRTATDNFSDANKLGVGGFGVVYKGRLLDGQEIAVKRLSRNSRQGNEEFKNEVVLVAKLQHRNLVRLMGFCLDGEEKLLVYEFVLNRSLDHFIFDPINRAQLDWERRYKIIEGIARGLLYLHEDSRLRIIHRDLKASNILLDIEMSPKISDFGMARLFVMDQSRGNTNRVVGTYGYMAPEYVIHGRFSVKSDVFSFGVLILEIVSGQRNNQFHSSEDDENLLSYAWRCWQEGRALELIDPTFSDGSSRSEMMKCIHIGLLCVQESVADRPIMSSIVLMLNSNSVTLPVPSEPAFFVHSRTETDVPSREYNSQRIETKWSVNEASITELNPR